VVAALERRLDWRGPRGWTVAHGTDFKACFDLSLLFSFLSTTSSLSLSVMISILS
jgi:hypothetical protein